MSAPILVSTSKRRQAGSKGNTNSSLSHTGQPTNFSITRYGDSSLEIFWNKPGAFSDLVYQVYRNGVFLAFAPEPSFFDAGVTRNTANHYTIVVVEKSAREVVGVGFVNEPAQNGK